MKTLILTVLVIVSFSSFAQTITQEDFKTIQGEWTGTLTYLNYSDNKPFSMPADLVVEKGNNEFQLILQNIYPNEPKANGSGKIKISKDRKTIDKAPIVSRELLPGGSIKIITESSGKDDNKKAQIRKCYTFGQNELIIVKEVLFEDSEKWIKRNEYNYTRKK